MSIWQIYLIMTAIGITRFGDGCHVAFSSVETHMDESLSIIKQFIVE